MLLNTEHFEPQEVPTYEPQVLAQRLYGLPTVIPMDYNQHVQRYINVYTVRKRTLTSKVLGLSRVYFPIFEEYLDRAGLPIELKIPRSGRECPRSTRTLARRRYWTMAVYARDGSHVWPTSQQLCR